MKPKGVFPVCMAIVLSAVLSSCDTSSLPTSTPVRENMDATSLASLVGSIRADSQHMHIDSLLIVRNGRLVLEEYFNGYRRESLHTIQSVTKSFTSALIGIAVNDGILDTDQAVLSFFTDATERSSDPRWAAMKIRDILTMRTGTDYTEGFPGSPHDILNSLKGGWDKFYLSRSMNANPGERFQYDSGGVILLSSILKSRTGVHADVYAAQKLFPQLGIVSYHWNKNAEGHPHTGGGLFLRPMDMAKLGVLYLQNGSWNGVQVIPESWVKQSTTQQVTFEGATGCEKGYGYLWWILQPDPRDPSRQPIVAAKGYMGQLIFVIRAYNMVVVFTGSSAANEALGQTLLYDRILPAVQAAEPAG